MVFVLAILIRKLKRERRKEENEGLEEDDGATQQNQKNRDSKRRTEK